MNKLKEIFKNEKKLSKIIPFYKFRDEQFEMAASIYDVISNNEILLIESPCGTGKTLSYIIPIMALSQSLKRKIVISTSTITLQNQLISDFIEPLSILFPQLTHSKLLGKSNYLCLKRAMEYIETGFATPEDKKNIELLIKDGGEFENKSIEHLRKEILTLNCKYELCENFKCPWFSQCFYFNNRKNSNSSDIIVVNHSLYMSEKKLLEDNQTNNYILPKHSFLIIDEAHKIPDSITSTFTETFHIGNIYNELFILDRIDFSNISKESIQKIYEFKKKLLESGEKFIKFLKKRYKRRENFFVISVTERNKISQSDEYLTFLEILNDFYKHLCEQRVKPGSPIFKVRTNFEKIIEFFSFLENRDGEHFFWIDNGKNLKINQSPYSVDDIFNRYFIENLDSMVMLSGTLGFKGDFSFFKEQLNIADSIDLSYYKEFDSELSRICYIPKSIPTPKEEGFFSSLIIEIDSISRVISGRILVLFTSLSLMNSSWEELKVPLELNGKVVLVQGEMNKTQLMKKFKENENSILFASQSFWEGIDLKGNPLRGLIMTRLPFSVPDDPVIKARSEKLKEDGRNPFMEMFVPMAIIRLKQGIGRLIRDKKEWGVLSILDSRILNSRYGKLFLRELNELEIVSEIDEVEDFIARNRL